MFNKEEKRHITVQRACTGFWVIGFAIVSLCGYLIGTVGNSFRIDPPYMDLVKNSKYHQTVHQDIFTEIDSVKQDVHNLSDKVDKVQNSIKR